MLLPAPAMLDGNAVRVYDEREYAAFDKPQLAVGKPAKMRQVRMVNVDVPLVAFDPVSGTATATERSEIVLSFSVPSAPSVAFRDQVFSGIYDRMILNARDIPRFASPFTSRSNASKNGTRVQAFDTSVISWIDVNAPYVKLSLTREGLYRLTADEIRARSGVDIKAWQPSALRLFNRGQEVHLHVEEQQGEIAAIEFYGERLRGPYVEYYNWETDTNAYWLTNSSKFTTPAKRYQQKTHAASGNVVREGEVVLHHERDNDHYGGRNTQSEIATAHRTQWIPLERYIWSSLSKGEKVTDSFHVKLPQTTSGKTATIQCYVNGASYDENISENHRVEIRLNGEVIADRTFLHYDSVVVMSTVPLTSLRNGTNLIEITSLGTESKIDEFYLDHYKVILPAALEPSIDTAIAKGQFDFTVIRTQPNVDLAVRSAEAPVLYDLTSFDRLTRTSVSGNEHLFADDLTHDSTRYVAATQGSFLRPDQITPWNIDGKGWQILSSSNAADYIALTHPEFLHSAGILKLSRDKMGLRTKVVTTDEVFNAFSFGSNEAWSIRRFLDYAYHNYSGVPVSYVTLVGDASWDPKFNRTNKEYYAGIEHEMTRVRSFVPSYGIPNSDFIFTTVDGIEAIDTLMPDMVISRVPVQTPDEADDFVSKLAEYESQDPQAWNREFMFVIGGKGGPGEFEHARFMEDVRAFTDIPPGSSGYSGGLKFPPLNVRPTVIPRLDFSGPLDNTQIPRLQTEFREGKSLVYYTGHAATFTTDVNFGDAGLYRNKGLYPVFITLSCRTGAFGEPYAITFNEAFLKTPNGGVVSAFGTTGFGEIQYDYFFSSYMFQMLRADSLFQYTTKREKKYNIAALWTAAKVLASFKSYGNIAENCRLQYSNLGDAAMGFAFRPQPEFHIERSDVRLSGSDEVERSAFSTADTDLHLRIAVHNFGYSAEGPVVVRARDVSSLGNRERSDTLLVLHVDDTLFLQLPIDSNRVGDHKLVVTIDPDNVYDEDNEADNEIEIPFTVSGQGALALFPFEAASGMCELDGDSIRLLIALPESKFVRERDKLEIEFDTTAGFTSSQVPAMRQTGYPLVSITAATRDVRKSASSIVFWRMRTVIAGEASNWSVNSFNSAASSSTELLVRHRDQLEHAIQFGLVVANDRLKIPESDTLRYTVIAHSITDTNVSGISVSQIFRNDRPIYEFGETKAGFAIVALTADMTEIASIDEFSNIPFDTVALQQELARQVDSVVKAIPEGRIVFVLTNKQPFVPPAFTRDVNYIQPALRSLGALEGFDNLDYFQSYALIGRKGAAPGSVLELRTPSGSGGAELSQSFVTLGSSGLAITPFTAIAKSYSDVRWTGAVPPGGDITFTILGERRADRRIARLTSFKGSDTKLQSIATIDANVYSRIAVEASFKRESSGTVSPELGSISIGYEAAPEFAMTELTLSSATVEEGSKLIVTTTASNLLCFGAESVTISLVQSYSGSFDTLRQRTVALAGGASVRFIDTLETFGLQGLVKLTAIVNPFDRISEQFATNNIRSVNFTVTRDSLEPELDVLFDDKHINNGDFVSDRVTITMKLLDSGPVRLSDSLAISALIRYSKELENPVYITAINPPIDYRVVYETLPSGELQAQLIVQPKEPLKPGEYTLYVYANDASGNAADTLDFTFRVSAVNGVQQVMNYPNPFTGRTDFTFVLQGRADGASAEVHVYTVAGRKIKTLESRTLRTGINFIPWDGRDDNGNEVGNGNYPYRLVIRAANNDGSTLENGVTETAVKSK